MDCGLRHDVRGVPTSVGHAGGVSVTFTRASDETRSKLSALETRPSTGFSHEVNMATLTAVLAGDLSRLSS